MHGRLESRRTHFLDTSGTGAWADGPNRLHGLRKYGSSAMCDDGRILYAGGAGPLPTATAEILDLNAATLAWQWTGSMHYARRH